METITDFITNLVFLTPSLISWNCDLDTWSEETTLEPGEIGDNFVCLTHKSGLIGHRFSLRKLYDYISDYTRRTLTYGSDILPAFQGVMRRYEAMTGERLHWGLPYKIVDMGNSLMWQPKFEFSPSEDERQDLRKVRLDDGTAIHMLYPSWSWMRWNGSVNSCWRLFSNGSGYVDSGSVRPELDFYRLMSDGHVELLAPRQPPIPAGIPNDECTGRLTQPLARLWKGPTAIDGPVLAKPNNGGLVLEMIPAQLDSTSRPIPVCDTGRLVFRTSHAKIKTWSVYGQKELLKGCTDLHLQLPGRVVAASDKWHGVDTKASFHMPRNTSSRLFGCSHLTPERGDDAASRLLSYVVVGENHEWEALLQSVHKHPADGLPPQKPAFLNVLIIEWVNEEKGIARRAGTAFFPELEWMALDRDWRLIILE